jgi:hypothetical protein
MKKLFSSSSHTNIDSKPSLKSTFAPSLSLKSTFPSVTGFVANFSLKRTFPGVLAVPVAAVAVGVVSGIETIRQRINNDR